MIKAILFDFDGTLVDSKQAFLSAYNQMAAHHHFHNLTLESFDRLRRCTMKERCAALSIPMHKLPFLIGELTRLYRQSLMQIHLMDGVMDMINQLSKSGFDLAIISSNEEKNIRMFLQSHETDCISTIMCSRKLFAKDRLMRKYLKKHQLKAEEALYIGDEERDIRASRKSGISVIWAKWGFDSIENVRDAKPDYIADHPNDVMQIVQSLQSD
ncbi:HAD-IA family hydrolase [Sporolactobacillus kofuensis]|uniref:HAD-IA family hydrolase n=1 Tax=Sporolactobacillus kofuensis TaxID=269672 RepID=A0ABW1WF90_9BACL|nr:HAD-IA family hydrolase [Sporolactobacillus kofuensis]MCO7174917.1 HAD-IA family hydrolase [Sporolactobacillus kofuensis]